MLSLFILIPGICAIIIGLLPGKLVSRQISSVALMMATTLLALTVKLAIDFDLSDPSFQFAEHWDWIPQLGLSYSLGIDGLSFSILALNEILTTFAIACKKGNL